MPLFVANAPTRHPQAYSPKDLASAHDDACARRGGAKRWTCLALLSILLVGCSDSDSPQRRAPEAVPVTLAPVTRGPLQRNINVVGTLYGDEETTISAKVGGRIVAIFHDMGDRVPRGTVLAQIDPTDFELARTQKDAALRQALAKLGLSEMPGEDFDPESVPPVRRAWLEAENAKSRFERGRQLHEQTPPRLSDQEFSDLKTAWEVAQSNYSLEVLNARATLAEARTRAAELRQADQMLTDATIRAPAAETIPGTTNPARLATAVPITATDFAVAQRSVSVGEYVREGAVLFRLIDDDPIKLRAAVPERFLAEVSVDQPVKLTIESYPDAFTGKVTRINPQVDPASRNFTVEAVVPNERGLLRPGGFAKVQLLTRMDESVIFSPAEAIVSFAGVNRVFVVSDGKAVEKVVELGERFEDRVEIRSGLSGDEQVVITNAARLAAETPVTVSPSATSKPSPR